MAKKLTRPLECKHPGPWEHIGDLYYRCYLCGKIFQKQPYDPSIKTIPNIQQLLNQGGEK
jgi:hypothetical protein